MSVPERQAVGYPKSDEPLASTITVRFQEVGRGQLVAYYEEDPVEVKGKLEIHQSPISAASGARSAEGAIRPALVYVQVTSEAGPFLVPFGAYDDVSS